MSEAIPPPPPASPEPAADGAPAAKPPKRKRRLFRWLRRGLLALLLLLVGLVAFVVWLPLETLTHKLVLPKIRQTLGFDDIHAGGVDFNLLEGLEIRDLRVGPPPGFKHDLMTLKTVRVKYDLTGITEGVIRIEEVLVESPAVFLEVVDGKSNVEALLEMLPPSEPPPEEEKGPLELPDLRVEIARVALTGFQAGFADGNQSLSLGKLDVALSGTITQAATNLKVEVDFRGAEKNQPNIQVAQRLPDALAAAVEFDLDVDIDITAGKNLADPKAKVKTGVVVATHRLEGPLAVPPVRFELDLAAGADLGAGTAALEGLAVRLNGESLLRVRARAEDFDNPAIDATIEEARLPLAVLVPFINAVLPEGNKLELTGALGVENLALRGKLDQLAAGALPDLSGRVFILDLGLDVETHAPTEPVAVGPLRFVAPPPPPPEGEAPPVPPLPVPGAPIEVPLPALVARVGPIDAGIDFKITPGAQAMDYPALLAALRDGGDPVVKAGGEIRIARVEGFGALVQNLGLKLGAAASLDGQIPTAGAVTLDVELESAEADPMKAYAKGLVVKVTGASALVNNQPDQVAATFSLDLAEAGARAMGASARKLAVNLTTDAQMVGGLPANVRTALDVDLAAAHYTVPGMGPFNVSFGTRVTAQGDPIAQDLDVALERFAVDVNDLIKVRASAKAESLGRESLSFDFDLAPIDLRALTALPPVQKAMPPGMSVRGRVATSFKLRGKLPPMEQMTSFSPGAAFWLPVNLELTQRLENISVVDKKAKLEVNDFDGTLQLRGPLRDLRFAALGKGLRIKHVQADDLRLEGVEIPLDARITTRSVSLETGVRLASAKKKGLGLDTADFEAMVRTSAQLPLPRVIGKQRFDLEGAELGVDVALGRTRMTSGDMKIELGAPRGGKALRQHIALVYDPKRAPSTDEADAGATYPIAFTTRTELDHLGIKAKRLEVSDLAFEETVHVGGVRLDGLSLANPIPKSKPRWIRVTGGIRPLDGRALKLKVGGTPLVGDIADNTFENDIIVSLPRLRYPPLDKEVSAEVAFVEVAKLDFRNGSHGLRARLDGRVGRFNFPGTRIPQIDLHAFAGLELPEADKKAAGRAMIASGSAETNDRMAVRMAGRMGLEVDIRNAGEVMEIAGALVGNNAHIWLEQHGQDPSLPDGTRVFTKQDIHVRDLDMRIPVVQRADLRFVDDLLANPDRYVAALMRNPSVARAASRQVLAEERSPIYDEMLAYRRDAAGLRIDGIAIDKTLRYVKAGEEIDKVTVPTRVDDLRMDAGYEDWVFAVDQLGLRVLDGDIAARLAVQLKSLQPVDVDVVFRGQAGGLNLARLGSSRKTLSSKTEISMMSQIDFALGDRELNGFVHVSRLSLAQLDAVLKAADPARRNEQIQKQRATINNFFVRDWLDPSVRYVDMQLKHSNLDFKTKFGAVWGARQLLNGIMEGAKVENLDIRPILDNVVENAAAKPSELPPIGEPPEPDIVPPPAIAQEGPQ